MAHKMEDSEEKGHDMDALMKSPRETAVSVISKTSLIIPPSP